MKCLIALVVAAALVACGPSQEPQPAVPMASITTVSAPPTAAAPAELTAAPAAPTRVPVTSAPAVSALGTAIYQSVSDGSLQAIDIATGGATALADPTEHGQRLPWAASPDGRTIAVVSGHWNVRDQTTRRAALWTVGVDGSAPQKLLEITPPEPPQNDFGTTWQALANDQFQHPVWTPDGREIVVASAHEGQLDLYAVASDGRAVRRLTDTPDFEIQASLSPDGRELAYGSTSSFGTGGGWGNVAAWVQPLAGGERRSLLGASPDQRKPSAISIAGWVGDGAVAAVTHNNVDGKATVHVLARGATQPVVHLADSRFGIALGDHQLAFAAGAFDGQAIDVFVWPIGAAAPTRVTTIATAGGVEVYLSPDESALLLCASADNQPASLMLWSANALHALGAGGCDYVAWEGERLASGGNRELSVSGLVVGADGRVRWTLPVDARPAKWSVDTLLLFAPAQGADGRWQLYRTSGNDDVAIGESFAGPPEGFVVVP
jgi:dipeptidyl aminopeptidase/acylaminoacyl peptidase